MNRHRANSKAEDNATHNNAGCEVRPEARTRLLGRDTNRNPRVKQGLRLITSVRDLIVVGSSEGLQLWPRGLLSGPLPPPPEPLIAGG